jgi:formylglycine-generating enzyme required for sulfatase activity
MPQVQIRHIVVASPGDVQAERNALATVVEELNHGIARDRRLRLELVRWETDAYPGFHPEGPQGLIDAILRIEECDILIGIFWKRFGTPVNDAQSGTEHEFRRGYESWKRTGRPHIMVYFNQRAYTPKTREETDQWGQVLDFRRNFPKEGLWWPYRGRAQFERLVRNHLTQVLRQQGPEPSRMRRMPSDPLPPASVHQHGSGAVAIGPGATAAGEGGVAVGGSSSGNINLGPSQVGLERQAERAGLTVRESPFSGSHATAERRPADPEGATPQTPPERASTGVPPEVRRQLELMRSSHIHVRERVAAGEALARHGDPRFRADAWYLPDEPLLGFVEIPEGQFLMGSDEAQDPGAFSDERPQHEVTLAQYYIGRYPVTVGQFLAFIEGTGIRPEDPDSLQGLSNNPVVYVSWNEALKYCDWLTDRLRAWQHSPEPLATLLHIRGWQVTLPSEAEWEKAARGTDGRIYPWGNAPDPDRANYHGTGINAPSAVGCFPGGASPYGVEDLSGNVWEWTRSVRGNYPYPTDSQERARRENLSAGDSARVLRGGAFYKALRFVRCASRLRNDPYYRHMLIGFRVVVHPAF